MRFWPILGELFPQMLSSGEYAPLPESRACVARGFSRLTSSDFLPNHRQRTHILLCRLKATRNIAVVGFTLRVVVLFWEARFHLVPTCFATAVLRQLMSSRLIS